MKKFIIAPNYLSKSINQFYFKNDPFYDVKIISREDLYSAIYGVFKEDALIYLLANHDFTYQNAKMYLKAINYIQKDSNNSKMHFLYILRSELISKGFLFKNEYDALMFQNKDVLIYGYKEEDIVLKDIINKLLLKPTFCDFSSKVKIDYYINEFVNLEDESFYVMNQISSLIDTGVNINDIYLYVCDSNYYNYFDLFCDSFNFKIINNIAENYYSLGICSEFLKIYRKNQNIDESIELLKNLCKDDIYLADFISEINKNRHDELSFFKQFDLLINVFKEDELKKEHYLNAVKTINKPTILENKHIFIVGFNNDNFPSIIKDNDYLTDTEKVAIGINSSLIETKENHDILYSFLRSDNNFYISYSLISTTSRYSQSPFVIEYKLHVVHPDFPAILYSSIYADFYFAKARDKEELYKEKNNEYFSLAHISNIPYNTYDNQFKLNKPISFDIKELSFTSTDKYFNCPFSFYLDRVVQLDDFESTFFTKLGNIAHCIFERMFDDDFDFEKVYLTAKEKQEAFSNREELLLVGLKADLKTAVDANLLHLKYIKNYQIFTEKNFKYTIDQNTILVGRIDKGIIIDDKYLVIVDYKTGSTSFEDNKISLGLSLQLPIYCLLSSENKEYNSYQVGGIYTNNVINQNNSKEIKEDELIPSYLKLNGKTLNNEEFIQSFDSTIADGKSCFITSLKMTKAGILSGKTLIGEEIFNDYIKLAKEKVNEANLKIKSNQFEVKPQFVKSDSPCKRCSYRDVCFLKSNQIVYPVKIDSEEENE